MELHLLLPLTIAPAILLGELLRRVGLPAVVGQILAGVLLGPMVFGLLQPMPSGEFSDADHSGYYELAQIGLCVLLFKIGLETQVSHFTRVWREALTVAGVGMVLPFGLGFGGGLLFGWSPSAALFLGSALTATSIGVTAAVIDELGVQGTAEARIVMGAAVVDDVLGLLLLSALAAPAVETDSLRLGVMGALGQAIVFLVAAVVLGPFIVRAFDKLTDWLRSEALLIALAFGYLLLMASLAEHIGLAEIIGSYSAGLVFSKRDEAVLEGAFEPLTALLAPVFFVLIGASIVFEGWIGWPQLAALLVLTVVAVGSKFAAPWLVPLGEVSRAAVGSGLVPRGEVGLVFAQVGLSSLALTQSQYSILTLILVATTLAGPVMLRRFVTD